MRKLRGLIDINYTGESMIGIIGKKWTRKLASGTVAVLLIFGSAAPVLGGEGAWARKTLRKLSLREKIAQMMIYTMNMRLIF
jgi:hypothetical protein